ncbi:MAG: DUF4293 domain-containing protein [Bacteroidota bacterium]
MLQRIQTLYLIAALICTGLMFYLPIWKSGENIGIDSLGAGTHLYLLLIATLLGLFQIISIFFYKERKTQILFCNISIFITIVYLLTFFVIFLQENEISNLASGIQIGTILPILIIVFKILAITNIRKDEELIRSMDRLR